MIASTEAPSEADRDVGYVRLRDAIRHDIVEGVHLAGTRLKVPMLCAAYEASAIPVREALQALQGEGLVTMEPHRGAVVRAVDADFVRQIYEIREALEGFLAARFVAIAPAGAIAAIEAAQARMERTESLAERHAADRAFHRLILTAAGNEQAFLLIERQNNVINALRLRYGQSDARRDQVQSEHHALLAALADRDAGKASAIAALHARNAFNDLIFRMRSGPLPSQPRG